MSGVAGSKSHPGRLAADPGSASAARSERQSWPELPRRGVARPHSALTSIRTPLSRGTRWALMVLSLLLPFVVWGVLTAAEVVTPRVLPPLPATLAAGWDMAVSGELFTDLWASTERVLYGFGLGLVVAVPLGILMGAFRAGEALFEPVFAMLRYLPAPAFIPVFLVWFGIDEAPKIALVFVGTVFFNTLMTADVVRAVPRELINVSYTLGARRGEVLRKVIVPHSLPGIIDTIRVNIAVAWALLVIAEVVSSTTGLGRSIMQAQRFQRIDEMFALLLVIGVIGVVMDVTLRLLRARVGRWAQ
ncbi:ABC transporter permease [Actinophytocola sp.]|uniref:ABC transporter permease n=1 Tax=Actinophytocola sp. TaxID=1872138 RepID=UPI002ED426C7